jgi:hypothetical protein
LSCALIPLLVQFITSKSASELFFSVDVPTCWK